MAPEHTIYRMRSANITTVASILFVVTVSFDRPMSSSSFIADTSQTELGRWGRDGSTGTAVDPNFTRSRVVWMLSACGSDSPSEPRKASTFSTS